MEGTNYPQMVVVPLEYVKTMEQGIAEIKEMLNRKIQDEINSQWVLSTDARKELGVSQKTWQTYRDNNVIPFSQFGRKIYVKRSDLNAFLDSHRVGRSLNDKRRVG